MPLACWPAAPRGWYWIDVAIAGRPLRCTIDLGLVDPRDEIGFELEPTFDDQLARSGAVSAEQSRIRRDANGRSVPMLVGMVSAQLLDPASRQAIGPTIQLYAARGAPGLYSRVGVVFFHRLTGCRVVWELDTRTWCIECP